MKVKLTYSLILFLLTILPLISISELHAQRVQPNRWLVEADGGMSVFFGDVKRYDYVPDYESPSEMQPFFSASLGKELSKIFTIRGQFQYGKLSGHKQSSHFNFSSNIMGGHLMTDISLYYLFTNSRFGSSKINAFASLGAGYLMWDTELLYDTPQADGTSVICTSKMGAFSIPGSITFEYAINKNFAINVEGALYVVTSDEVDAKPGGIKVDMINYNSLGLVYKFATKSKARKSRIKYELDAALYESKPGDPHYVDEKVAAVDVPTETPEEIQVAIDSEQEIAKEELVQENIVDDTNLPTEDKVLVANDTKDIDQSEVKKKDHERFPINHELENMAIEKETWASRSTNPWPEIEFSVQILAAKAPVVIKRLQGSIAEKIVEKYDGEWYRYSAGSYDKMWRAKELRNKLRSVVGYKDAFIVVYRNEERISLAEALNYVARNQTETKEEFIREDRAASKVYPMVQLEHNIPAEGIVFGVQVLSIQNSQYPIGVFKGLYGFDNEILIHEKAPWYKLIVSSFNSYEQAVQFQAVARDKGFIDAFVVAFKDGRRISIRKLQEELNK